MVGDGFVAAEDRGAGDVAAVGERIGNGFDFSFAEADAGDLDFAVGGDQKKSGNGGQAVSVGDGIAGGVEQDRESDAEFVGKIAGGAGVVLGNGEEGDLGAAVGFENAFQERESEFADRAGDFEEGQHDRAAFECSGERKFFAIERLQREAGCEATRNDV